MSVNLPDDTSFFPSYDSKADKILTKAVEIERRNANSELEKVRESMKGVLERERMLMRGRLADTLNSRTRNSESERNNTYIESKPSLIEDGRLGSEEVIDLDEYEEQDSIWGRRQRSIRRDSNNFNY